MAEQAVEVREGVATNGPRLTGRFPAKIDSKGRVILPAPLRQHLGGAPASFFPAFSGDELMVGGPALYDDLLDLMLGLDEFDEDRQVLELMVSQRMVDLVPDEAGRVVLPRDLRALVEGSAPLGFAGRGSHYALTGAEGLDDLEARAKAAAERHAETLKVRMLPSVARGRRR